MYYKIIIMSILICNMYNTYSAQKYSNADNIEIYKPYYQKLLNNNLRNNISRIVPSVSQANNLQSIYNNSQTLLQTNSSQLPQINSLQLSHNSYITNSSMQSSIYSSSQTSETNICNKTISSQNSKSNIYDILDSNSYTSSNNNSIFINMNQINQAQSNTSHNSMYSNEQQHSNLIHLNINFNNSIIYNN